MKTFSERLNEAMKIKDVRAVDLSKATGISKSRISQYIHGVYEAKQTALYLLAKALNVSEVWLMGYDVPMERTTCSDNHTELEEGSESIVILRRGGKSIRKQMTKEQMALLMAMLDALPQYDDENL